MSSSIYDIIVIGGGPAGLTAAIYTARMGNKTLLLEREMYGGRAAAAPLVWNYPGFPEGIKGSQLVELMVDQAQKFDAELKYGTEVLDLKFEGRVKQVVTREAIYNTHAIIVATGTQRKKLQIQGEAEYIGRGVSYCPLCDGPLYRNLKVAVIGSDYEAFEDAFYLAGFAEQVTLITHSSEIKAEKRYLEEARVKPNLSIVKGELLEIKGDQVVDSISYRLFEEKMEHELVIDGVFIAIGGVPLTALVKKVGVNLDTRGCIDVSRQQLTNVKGVFAAGDCTCGGMQITTATGEGAMAGIQAYRYVRQLTRK